MTIQSHYLRLLDAQLERLQQQIAPIQAQIADLETTRRVILSLQSEPEPKPEPIEKPKVRVKAARAKSKTSVRADIIQFMEENPGPVKSAEVIKATGRPNHAIWAELSALAKDGTVNRESVTGGGNVYTYTLNREPT